ncbi:hypothetical protein EMPS_09721 [Entomortierella parvispora]|uniref:F-box domain-containing protein n=1 Tax=Entomortierella parvispora TaxID=205924 RepID=A0A9P3M0M7_9FUNG|nr:hypothetical protein EMPS_09721 [Entomortierella parvispora]
MARHPRPILRRSSRLIEQPGYLSRQGHRQRNPFDVPEILLELGQYLDLHTLTVCIRVSRQWQKTLTPQIWADLHLNFRCPPKIPSPLAFRTHSVHVRRLKIVSDRNHLEFWNLDHLWREGSEKFPLFCPNLSHLTVQQGRRGFANSLVNIVLRHRQTLRCLTFSGRATQELIEALTHCPQLKCMESGGMSNATHFLEAYERLWSRLEVVSFRGSVHRMSQVPSSEIMEQCAIRMGPSRIQRLTFDDDRNMTLYGWMVQQSPQLIHLQCCSSMPDTFSPMRWLAFEIEQTIMDRSGLQSLALPYQTFRPEVFRYFLSTVPRIKKLDLSSTNFSRPSWMTMRLFPRHLHAITELTLDSCRLLQGAEVVEMLTMMPNLEVLYADGYLKDEHVLGDFNRPWACRGLKVLAVDVEQISSRAQRMFMKRLSELVRLETCCLCAALNASGTIGYRLELDGGLDRLRTLGRLRSFAVHNTNGPIWGMEEVQWMQRFWPKLDSLRGFSMDEDAASLLEQAHVSYESDDNWSDDGSDDEDDEESDDEEDSGSESENDGE